MLTERVKRWRAGGEMIQFRGHQLYVRRREGRAPLLLLLHGFPTCSYDWRRLLDLRLSDRAVLMFDCLGFGLSDKPSEHVYSLGWQADAAEELVRRAGSPQTFLVAHDMGTSVATELMARAIRGELTVELEGALLFNGSILLDKASLTIAQKALRSRLGPLFAALGNERAFRYQLGRLFSSRHPLGREEAEDQWALVRHNRGHRLAHRTVHYLGERVSLSERWHGAFRDWPGRLSLAWGLEDPVATTSVLHGLRQLRPGVTVHELPQVGHYPQIEDPVGLTAALEQALAR